MPDDSRKRRPRKPQLADIQADVSDLAARTKTLEPLPELTRQLSVEVGKCTAVSANQQALLNRMDETIDKCHMSGERTAVILDGLVVTVRDHGTRIAALEKTETVAVARGAERKRWFGWLKTAHLVIGGVVAGVTYLSTRFVEWLTHAK